MSEALTVAPLVPANSLTTVGAAPLAVGVALPDRVVSTEEVAAGAGVDPEWMLSRTGIRERRHARPDERLSDLATAAGRQALERAGVSPADLDLVLVGTVAADEITPNAAPLVAHALGATRAGAWDVGAACSAFLAALSTGTAAIESGRAEHVLVIGVDFLSRWTDWKDRATAALFSDGAGAIVLGATEGTDRVGPVLLRADGAHAEKLIGRREEGVLRMDGPEVFKHAVARMGEVLLEAVAQAGCQPDDIDLWVLHQANARILRAVAAKLDLPSDRVVESIATLGNNSAATLPLALDAARADGRLQTGSTVALAAFGAGFTWGGAVLRWG